MRVHVLFHDRCFDGLASAATFTRFYRERIDPAAEFTYRGLTHKPGTCFTPDTFTDAPVHACVDFRFSPSEKLTWWFDHHQSAFEQPGDEEVFRTARQDGKHFWDPAAKSCTRFLARVAAERYGFDTKPMSELLEWAETIDGALFPDAKTAVELEAPAMKLMLLAEATTDNELIPRIIRELAVRPLSEVVASDFVQKPLKPLLDTHWDTLDAIRDRARRIGPVCTFDLADEGIDNFNKFISYYLYPEALYTVAVSRGAKRSKVSVGSNPWRQAERRHNIAAICESYGGGGHPAVGAVSLPPDRVDEARRVASEIIAKLQA